MKTLSKQDQAQINPQRAKEILLEGNQRFVNSLRLNRNYLQQVNETSEGQNPFAVVLSCIDSRTSAELIFDQGLGDIFSARIAGNIVNEDILGSMEFACKVAGSKLVVVLGHTSCGAVKGACDHVEMGNLSTLLHKIKPSIDAISYQGERSAKNKEFVEMVSEENVHRMLKEIPERSPILKEMIEKGQIGIVGGMYNVETGIVEFYN